MFPEGVSIFWTLYVVPSFVEVSQECEQSDTDERRDDDVSPAKVDWKKLCSFDVEVSSLNVQPSVFCFG